MDPTLTKAEAHKVFGDLYRRSRPPELQEKVDRIVEDTSDIFVRIKRIEELDEEQKKKDRRPIETAGAGRAPIRGSGGGGGGEKKPAAKRAPQKAGGLLSVLFGGDLAKWGRDTGTITSGFLALNLKISTRVDELFQLPTEDEVVPTIRCFRYAARHGWNDWEPQRYNTVMAAHLFFLEYVTVRHMPNRKDQPQVWINSTIKLQKYYALLQLYPDYRKIITEDFPAFIKKTGDLANLTGPLRSVMEFVARLDTRIPSFKNSVLAYYATQRKAVPLWEDVVRELGIRPPNVKQYRAPEDVMKDIQSRVTRLREKMMQRQAQVHEIQNIRKKFFVFDANGKLSVDFLTPIVEDTVRRIYPENVINEALFNAHKKEPHRLLFLILKDLDLSGTVLLQGSVATRGQGQHNDVILFKSGLFNQKLETFHNLFRDMEQFLRKNKNMSYNFNSFVEDLKKEGVDALIKGLQQLVHRANDFFREMATDLRIILDNHDNAGQMEKSGKTNEKLQQSRSFPIENFTYGARFFPHADNELLTAGRYTGSTPIDAIQEMTRNLYNYLFIFRDEELIRVLNSAPPLNTEIQQIRQELARLGVETEDHTS